MTSGLIEVNHNTILFMNVLNTFGEKKSVASIWKKFILQKYKY